MCEHTDFEIIYYQDGVLLRRCKECGLVELRTDWIWCDVEAIQAALATLQ